MGEDLPVAGDGAGLQVSLARRQPSLDGGGDRVARAALNRGPALGHRVDACPRARLAGQGAGAGFRNIRDVGDRSQCLPDLTAADPVDDGPRFMPAGRHSQRQPRLMHVVVGNPARLRRASFRSGRSRGERRRCGRELTTMAVRLTFCIVATQTTHGRRNRRIMVPNPARVRAPLFRPIVAEDHDHVASCCERC